MLDTFFKKYAWAANLALLFAAAWLCARTVNTVVASVIRPRPIVDLASVPSAPVREAARPQLEPDRLYPLIGQRPPPPPDNPAEADSGQASTAGPRNCADPAATPVKTSLRAQLAAAVISDRPGSSLASITDLGSRETRVFGVGDDVMGAKVLSVERLKDERDASGTGFKIACIVCNNGRKEYVDFEPDAAPAAPPRLAGMPAPAPDSSQGGVPGDAVRKVTDNSYEVKRSYIDSTLSNLNLVATQARIVPSFKNGVANGFKLFSVQPNSLYSAIGIENGDVIQRINGYEMNSPDKALEVYQKLRESPRISIEIERNGQVIRKEYNVTGS